MNSEIKDRFAETLSELDQAKFDALRDAVEPLEKRWDKDCALFTQIEIHEIFKDISDKGNSIGDDCQILSQYVSFWQQYCIGQKANYSQYARYRKSKLEHTGRYQLNMEEVYTSEEYRELINQADTVFDKIFLQAMYEGIWIRDDYREICYLNLQSCHPEDNTIELSDGTRIQVTQYFMDLLIEGANTDGFIQVAKGTRTYPLIQNIMARDATLCFKRLDITSDTPIQIVKNRTKDYRNQLKNDLHAGDKFNLSNIRYSAFFNALQQAGYQDRFNDVYLYREHEDVCRIADWYQINYNKTPAGMINAMKKYFVSAD